MSSPATGVDAVVVEDGSVDVFVHSEKVWKKSTLIRKMKESFVFFFAMRYSHPVCKGLQRVYEAEQKQTSGHIQAQ